MSQAELAAFVQTKLEKKGIKTVLSGGAAVSFYVGRKYVSKDIDLVADWAPKAATLRAAMSEMEFFQKAKYFAHPDTEHLVEILPGPLSVGEQVVTRTNKVQLSTGVLRVLTPADAVKDRLAAYFYWHDTESLLQAIWIARFHKVDLKRLKTWAKKEKQTDKFENFVKRLKKRSASK